MWHPEKHFLVGLLLYIKKLFYMKSFDEFTSEKSNDGVDYIENTEAYLL